MSEFSLPLFMYGLGFISGMIFVWAFGAAHDAIINYYREQMFNRIKRQERDKLMKEQSNPDKPE